MTVLPLQRSILYGPVNSRRLGRSLGINLMPVEYKLCSFNCVYCHYGWTKIHTIDTSAFEKDMPRPDDVIDGVKKALMSDEAFDYLTFSGNGEPTLYPKFSSIVAEIVRLRDRHRPGLKIALLSNSSGLFLPDVRNCIALIDVPVFKLDAGADRSFKSINRPAQGVNFDEIVEHLQSLKGGVIQTVLLEGTPCNTQEQDLRTYFDQIRVIDPKVVHIYSIDRPVSNTNIRRVLPDDLDRIARMGTQETGAEFRPFYVR
jgi:wyosine [tRNA(Phe)-imidazoG37] synthetase (radical SAM superfamily)